MFSQAVATAHDRSPEATALAWMYGKWKCIVHICGSRRPETLLDSLTAGNLELTAEEIASIDVEGDVSA